MENVGIVFATRLFYRGWWGVSLEAQLPDVGAHIPYRCDFIVDNEFSISIDSSRTQTVYAAVGHLTHFRLTTRLVVNVSHPARPGLRLPLCWAKRTPFSCQLQVLVNTTLE